VALLRSFLELFFYTKQKTWLMVVRISHHTNFSVSGLHVLRLLFFMCQCRAFDFVLLPVFLHLIKCSSQSKQTKMVKEFISQQISISIITSTTVVVLNEGIMFFSHNKSASASHQPNFRETNRGCHHIFAFH
jgi:hypothetical protein